MIRVALTDFKPHESTILHIRFKVFVEEQGVDPKLEIDGLDPECLHAVAFAGDQAIGTGRLLPDGRIGRMAVLKEHRAHGVGRQILEALIQAARDRNWARVELSSQIQAVPFYEQFGFKPLGQSYLEAGILHTKMALKLENDPTAPPNEHP